MADNGDRNTLGRFTPGHVAAPGAGRPRNAITNAIRRMVDPEAIARFLIDTVNDPEAPKKDRLAAAEMILDRCEGKAIATTHTIKHAAPTLPPNWGIMSPGERAGYLDRLAHQPALPVGDES